MKKITILLLLLCFQFNYSQTQTEPLNVLFVGNSITYFNSLPQTFEAIAEEQGYSINLDQHTPGGTGFINHVGNATLYNKFDNTVWDYVILQPGSNESPAFSQPLASTIQRAETLRETFQTSIQQDPAHFLWGGYGDIHPNAKGSFMGACTFYNALFQRPIINSTVNATLSQADADYFRGIAENVTLNNFDDWNIDTLVAHANFTFNSNDGTTVNFVNTSTNYDTLSWDFGDNTSSTETNPSHVFDFSVQDSYDVYLTASTGCKEHHFKQTITQNSLGVINFNNLKPFKIFPNPVINDFTISTSVKTEYSYQLYDVLGKKIKTERGLVGNKTIDISNLSKGVYLLNINMKNKVQSIKLIKK